jgi:hypothetical protein
VTRHGQHCDTVQSNTVTAIIIIIVVITTVTVMMLEKYMWHRTEPFEPEEATSSGVEQAGYQWVAA